MGGWQIRPNNSEARERGRAKTRICKICKSKFMQEEEGQNVCQVCMDDLELDCGKDQY